MPTSKPERVHERIIDGGSVPLYDQYAKALSEYNEVLAAERRALDEAAADISERFKSARERAKTALRDVAHRIENGE